VPCRSAILLILWSLAAGAAKPGEFLLLPGFGLCPCQKAGPACGGRVVVTELWQGAALVRHYHDPGSRRALFAVQTAEQAGLAPWAYDTKGLCAYGDFNGDGHVDYSWFGQTGVSRDLFLFLSQPDGSYRRFDLLRTLSQALARKDRFHAGPDLHSGFDIVNPTLRRHGAQLRLRIGFGPGFGSNEVRYYQIEQADWVDLEDPLPDRLTLPGTSGAARP